MEPVISRGFHRRRPKTDKEQRIPPGQYLTPDFPVLSYGPTPHTPLDEWTFEITGLVAKPISLGWEEFMALPQETFTVDIHCVTKWTKLDTTWTGVSFDTLLERVEPGSNWISAFADGGYTANLPLAEVTGGRAWVAHTYDGMPLEAAHGGPARMVVPAHYFWKSTKWVRGVEFTEADRPGFWERGGYNNNGDPWREQRYEGD
jgi:DMSO/TMAO reductase YedYZ molybdopterin-dependent catalytic subunit